MNIQMDLPLIVVLVQTQLAGSQIKSDVRLSSRKYTAIAVAAEKSSNHFTSFIPRVIIYSLIAIAQTTAEDRS